MATTPKIKNFMSQFRDKQTKELINLTSSQFMDVWSHYDHDGNGYIEGKELDNFLREFISSVKTTDARPELVTDTMLQDIKACFMEAYDDNKDGKIDIKELAQLLPLEESFLLLFRFDYPLESSVEFMKIWSKYDKDGSGSIDTDELKSFLRDFLKKSKKEINESKLHEYTEIILQIFDTNKDGKLQLSEMAKLLPVKQNLLTQTTLSGANLNKQDIERIFTIYDLDNNGTIENEELAGFLKDILDLVKKDYDAEDIELFKDSILSACDLDGDGKVNKKELTTILLALSKHTQEDKSK